MLRHKARLRRLTPVPLAQPYPGLFVSNDDLFEQEPFSRPRKCCVRAIPTSFFSSHCENWSCHATGLAKAGRYQRDIPPECQTRAPIA